MSSARKAAKPGRSRSARTFGAASKRASLALALRSSSCKTNTSRWSGCDRARYRSPASSGATSGGPGAALPVAVTSKSTASSPASTTSSASASAASGDMSGDAGVRGGKTRRRELEPPSNVPGVLPREAMTAVPAVWMGEATAGRQDGRLSPPKDWTAEASLPVLGDRRTPEPVLRPDGTGPSRVVGAGNERGRPDAARAAASAIEAWSRR